MRCFKAKRELSLYLDGELKANRESALFSHLEKCETCRIEKEKMAAVSVILKRPKEIQPSLQFLNKVIGQVICIYHFQSPLLCKISASRTIL